MTEELFREDAYARRCEAEVTAAQGGGVCLSRTVFYCQGGGQPGDRGQLLVAGGPALEVIDTIRGGSLVFAYGPDPEWLESAARKAECADDALLHAATAGSPPGEESPSALRSWLNLPGYAR